MNIWWLIDTKKDFFFGLVSYIFLLLRGVVHRLHYTVKSVCLSSGHQQQALCYIQKMELELTIDLLFKWWWCSEIKTSAVAKLVWKTGPQVSSLKCNNGEIDNIPRVSFFFFFLIKVCLEMIIRCCLIGKL